MRHFLAGRIEIFWFVWLGGRQSPKDGRLGRVGHGRNWLEEVLILSS